MIMQIVRAKRGDARDISVCRRKSIISFEKEFYSSENLDTLLLNTRENGIIEELESEDVFCLVKDNKIIGTVSLDGNQISGLYVHPKYFNEGYSQKLLEFIENFSRSQGIFEVYVYSTLSSKDFYLHNGFSYEGIAFSVPVEKPTVFVYMKKKLFNSN